MSEGGMADHLSPEILLDLAEDAPVQASWKMHLAECETCSARVDELRRALTAASELDPPDPGKAYWKDFESRLQAEIAARSEKGKARSRGRWWALAAAVSLAIAGWLVWGAIRPTVPMPDESAETLLPPAEDDPTFQILLSFAGGIHHAEEIEETLYLFTHSGLDPSQLPALEQEQLREKLENLLKAEENEKS